MLAFLARRLLFGAATVVLIAFFAYGMIRLLRPELYPGQSVISGTWNDVNRSLLHLELGGPDYGEAWLDGYWADIFLLAAERLGVAPAHSIVFEDAPVGIQAAAAAGMRAICVLTPIRSRIVVSFCRPCCVKSSVIPEAG